MLEAGRQAGSRLAMPLQHMRRGYCGYCGQSVKPCGTERWAATGYAACDGLRGISENLTNAEDRNSGQTAHGMLLLCLVGPTNLHGC
jgi:hypothetical protein